jgi:phosphate transport system ATP-binding protein
MSDTALNDTSQMAIPPPGPGSPSTSADVARPEGNTAGELIARGVCAWFGSRLVLEDVNLDMPRSQVTALIGPSGCGKSTFIRTLNRMHEVVAGAQLAGSVELDGVNIYSPDQRANEVRRHIGMVFQRPNPFPAMSIHDNVLAGLRFTRTRVSDKEALVEESLARAGLWNEVKNRLRDLGGALSGGQQQRLCIARALAMKPKVLLMDEPCSALDPASTIRIEQTIEEIASDVSVVIVTHNMQQAQRVSHTCAFFLAAENQPGRIVETGLTETIFGSPSDPRTADYVHGRFG